MVDYNGILEVFKKLNDADQDKISEAKVVIEELDKFELSLNTKVKPNNFNNNAQVQAIVGTASGALEHKVLIKKFMVLNWDLLQEFPKDEESKEHYIQILKGRVQEVKEAYFIAIGAYYEQKHKLIDDILGFDKIHGSDKKISVFNRIKKVLRPKKDIR